MSGATLIAERENVVLQMPTDLRIEGVLEISSALGQLLADVFALYMKTKNFHWHIGGPHLFPKTQPCAGN